MIVIGLSILGLAIAFAIAGAAANTSDRVQEPADVSHPELPAQGEFVARQRQFCLGGNTNSCSLVIGAVLDERPGPTDVAEIERLTDEVCKRSAIDCRIVADILGKSARPRAVALARTTYDRACRGNEARACVAIAGMLEGEGSEGVDLAMKLYTRACDQLAEGSACARLAELWRNGVAGRKSLARARHYRDRACELGQTTSCAKPRRTSRPSR